MRIAVFSDIQANLPALDGFFQSIEKQKPDMLFCLGNLVGYNVWPNAVIDAIRKKGIPCLAAICDKFIGQRKDDFGKKFNNIEEKRLEKLSAEFTNEIIKKEERAFLRTLPSSIRMEFEVKNDLLVLLLTQGIIKNKELNFTEEGEKLLINHMSKTNTDILITANPYQPIVKTFKENINGKTRYRRVINPGSAGRPNDKDPRGCYTIISFDEKSNLSDEDSVKVEFIRFSYDIEKAAQAIEESPLPDVLAFRLRNGI